MKVILALCVIGAAALGGDNATPTTPGRYQLVAATITVNDTRPQPTLFKIDTATGRTWRYVYTESNMGLQPPNDTKNLIVNGWIEIEDFSNAAKHAAEAAEAMRKPK